MRRRHAWIGRRGVHRRQIVLGIVDLRLERVCRVGPLIGNVRLIGGVGLLELRFGIVADAAFAHAIAGERRSQLVVGDVILVVELRVVCGVVGFGDAAVVIRRELRERAVDVILTRRDVGVGLILLLLNCGELRIGCAVIRLATTAKKIAQFRALSNEKPDDATVGNTANLVPLPLARFSPWVDGEGGVIYATIWPASPEPKNTSVYDRCHGLKVPNVQHKILAIFAVFRQNRLLRTAEKPTLPRVGPVVSSHRQRLHPMHASGLQSGE